MFAQIGSYFLGHLATFIYLTTTVQNAEQFRMAEWPQMSLYNFLVAKFWPIYWIAYVLDKAKVQETYWHVFAVADVQVTKALALISLFIS